MFGHLLLPLALFAPTADTGDAALTALLKPICEKHQIPGGVAALVRGDKVLAIGSFGVRKQGAPDAFTIADKVHLGSCTKALTATLLGLLVEEGKLSWDSTVAGVFPELKAVVHADYRGVTLLQLLNHRGSIPAEWEGWKLSADRPPLAEKVDRFKRMLKDAPKDKPGTKYDYSNGGYILAGLMAEKVTGQSWEELMRKRVFGPLGMKSAGFGPPGSKDKVDQPWGHEIVEGQVTPTRDDNHPSLGPAGTIHCSLGDWAVFAIVHLNGASKKAKLLKPATFAKLHTPPDGEDYAAGWLVADREWAGGKILNHDGSNRYWYCTSWLAPVKGFAMLAAFNQGEDAGEKAAVEATTALLEHIMKKK